MQFTATQASIALFAGVEPLLNRRCTLGVDLTRGLSIGRSAEVDVV